MSHEDAANVVQGIEQDNRAEGGISDQVAGPEYAVIHGIPTNASEETEYAYAYADVNSTDQTQPIPNESKYQHTYADVNLVNQPQRAAGSEYAYADVKLNEQSISGNAHQSLTGIDRDNDSVGDGEWEVSSSNEDETNGWTANTVYATTNNDGTGTETDQEGWKDNIIYAGDE